MSQYRPGAKAHPIVSCPNCGKQGRKGGMANHIRRCGTDHGVRTFWARVNKGPHPKGCWIYRGHKLNDGHCDLMRLRVKILAHRYSWQLHFGPIPAGLCVLHHCDTPDCVRPDHLHTGTHADNARDKVSRNRQSYGERNPTAKLTEDMVRVARQLYAQGMSVPQIVRERYPHIKRGTLEHAVYGVTWKYIK
jgi:hypothetical protein